MLGLCAGVCDGIARLVDDGCVGRSLVHLATISCEGVQFMLLVQFFERFEACGLEESNSLRVVRIVDLRLWKFSVGMCLRCVLVCRWGDKIFLGGLW